MFDAIDLLRYRTRDEAVRDNRAFAQRLSTSTPDVVFLVADGGGLRIDFKAPAGSVIASFAGGVELPKAKMKQTA